MDQGKTSLTPIPGGLKLHTYLYRLPDQVNTIDVGAGEVLLFIVRGWAPIRGPNTGPGKWDMSIGGGFDDVLPVVLAVAEREAADEMLECGAGELDGFVSFVVREHSRGLN